MCVCVCKVVSVCVCVCACIIKYTGLCDLSLKSPFFTHNRDSLKKTRSSFWTYWLSVGIPPCRD